MWQVLIGGFYILSAYITDSKPAKGEKGEVSLVGMNKVDPDQNGAVTQNGKVPDEGKENGDKKKEEAKMVPPLSVVRICAFTNVAFWLAQYSTIPHEQM